MSVRYPDHSEPKKVGGVVYSPVNAINTDDSLYDCGTCFSVVRLSRLAAHAGYHAEREDDGK